MAMKVTSPVKQSAALYRSAKELRRRKKNTVDAAIEARPREIRL